MGHPSPPELLVLHGVRVAGFVDTEVLAMRLMLAPELVDELLLDAQARGWITRHSFADTTGWAVTDAGRAHDEAALAAELDAHGIRPLAEQTHLRFLPLNARFLTAMTDWQLRPQPWDRLAANDHTDWRWDERVLRSLGHIGARLGELMQPLEDALPRFQGYAVRYRHALGRVERGERDWVDGVGRDSCHAVWMQVHEDLIATLGIDRS